METWSLQDAKAHFSQVVKEASVHGPQEITVRGQPTAVLIAFNDFTKLSKPKLPFVEFIRKSPLVGVKLDLDRDNSPTRDVEL